MNYVIVDFEMNPIAEEHVQERETCKLEIIEIGAVIMDESFMVLGEFKTLVKPQYNEHIYKKYQKLTGITTDMVSGAPTFAPAYEMFVNWCESYEGEYEVYAWSENDYLQLTSEMKLKGYDRADKMGPIDKWYDFQKEFTKRLKLGQILSLERALNYSGMEIEGKMHDALWDAKNTARLMAATRDEKSFKVIRRNINEILKPQQMTSALGDMIDFGALMAQIA